MEVIIKTQTPKTPEVKIVDNILSIKGRGMPDNSKEYWDGIFKWLDKHIPSIIKQQNDFILDFSIEYFNIPFSKYCLDFLKYFEKLTIDENFKVSIVWNYEENDEDMLEAGKDFQAIFNMPFNLKLIEET